MKRIVQLGLAASLMALPHIAAAQEAATPTMDKGDVAWMLTSTLLVLFMTIQAEKRKAQREGN